MELRIRPYQPADFETLYQIDQRCYEPGIAYSRRTLRAFLREPGAQCLVAEEPSTGTAALIVGFILAQMHGSRGHIVTLDVEESRRRRGIGSRLLVEMEQCIAVSGVRTVELETATGNLPAVAFWRRHGYRDTELLKRYYGNGLDAYLMIKSLATALSGKLASAH